MELGKILEFRKDLYFEGAVQADWFYSPDRATKVAANFVFHGHTHQLKSELIDDELLLVNPGSLNNSSGIHPYKTYAIVNVTKDEYEVTFYDEDMKLLEELTHTYPR